MVLYRYVFRKKVIPENRTHSVIFCFSAVIWFGFTDGSLRLLDGVWFGLGAVLYRLTLKRPLTIWQKRFDQPKEPSLYQMAPVAPAGAASEQTNRHIDKLYRLSLKQKSETWTAGVFIILLRRRNQVWKRCTGELQRLSGKFYFWRRQDEDMDGNDDEQA